MAWDDAPPDSVGWDAAPPTPEELKPSYLEDVGSSALKEIKAFPASIPKLAKDALGVASMPMDALKSVPQILSGKDLADTDIAEDVKPIIEGNKSTLNTGEHPIDSFRKAPINTVMTAAGLLGGLKGMMPEAAEVPTVPRETIPKVAEGAGNIEKVVPAPLETAELPKSPPARPLEETSAAPGAAPELPAAGASAVQTPPKGSSKGPVAAESLRDLPVMQPGVKTGEPHALFAYNDDYGPGGTKRSIYNMFGDPGNPRLNQAGGYGSSVTKDILDQAGIPIVGREPRSVGKWEPLETEPAGAGPGKPPAPPSGPPPGGSGGPPEGPELPPGGKPSIFETGAQKAIDEAKELKDYVSRGYEGYAKKPGALADVADWVQEKSQMMAAQQMGFTPGQVRQLSKNPLEAHNIARAIGQYGIDQGYVAPETGLGGMLKKHAETTNAVGKGLREYRDMASKLAGEIDPKEVAAEVRKTLDKKYMRTVKDEAGVESSPRGAYGGQAGAYLKALQEVEDAEKSHSGIADAATELNHAANKAAKNLQPETPFTDVANEVSRINNERIKALIGPENAAKYEKLLREYGINMKIKNGLKFRNSGEVKRFGPGSTFSNMAQKGMDEFGYRLGAKTANKLSTAIKNNPSVGGSLPSLFKQFIHEVEDVSHDVTGMSKGGMVPDDVKRYVSKC